MIKLIESKNMYGVYNYQDYSIIPNINNRGRYDIMYKGVQIISGIQTLTLCKRIIIKHQKGLK